MREADFARIWKCAAAEQTNVADGVMRRPERSRRDKRFFSVEQTGNAVNFRRLDCFLERHGRNDGGNAFRKHRFARTRGSDHEDIVTAGHRDFDRAFNVALTFHVAEIDVVALVRRKKSSQIGTRRQKRRFAAQKSKCLPQILHAVDVDLIDHGGFERIGFRDEECAPAPPSCFQSDWEHALSRRAPYRPKRVHLRS